MASSLREDADVLGALHEDFVGDEERFVLVEELGEFGDDFAGAVEPAGGHVDAAAAEAHVVAHHAGAGERFEEVEDFFAFAEGVHQGRAAGAHVLQQEADEGGVVLQAGELAGDDAEVFGALGDLDAGEFFDGESVAPVVGDGAEVVEAVGVGHGAEVGFVLGDFFVVAVEVAEDGLELDDDFAVEDDVHAEDAVGRGVLRAHRDFEELLFAAVDGYFDGGFERGPGAGVGRGAHFPPAWLRCWLVRLRTSSCAVGSYS